MVFSFFMLNAIFVLVVYILQAKKEFVSIQWFIAKSYNVTYENDESIGPLVTVSGEYLNFEPIGKCLECLLLFLNKVELGKYENIILDCIYIKLYNY